MDELKIAWENFLQNSEQATLLKVVEEYIPEDFDPNYELSDEWFIETMKKPYLATHRICDIELCGKPFRVTRTSDAAEILTILPCKEPSFDQPGVSYSLSGVALQKYIHGKQQALEDEDAKWQAEIEERNRPDPVPICSPIIRFIPTDNRFSCCGEILLKSEDVEHYLENEVQEHQEHELKHGSDEFYKPSEILPWVQAVDASLNHDTYVPKQWGDKFQYISYQILEQKKGVVLCKKCQEKYTGQQLREDVDPYPLGTINGRFFCPNEHNLFEIELMRLC